MRTEGGGDSADTGCKGDDCLPDACSVLDLCDNGIDDDCNVEVDEAGCSLGWVIGTADGQGLGMRLDGY